MKILISTSSADPLLDRIRRLVSRRDLLKMKLQRVASTPAAKVKMQTSIDNLNAQIAELKAKLKVAQKAKPKETQKAKTYKGYDPLTMKGAKAFTEINGTSAFPKNVEGYWRASLKEKSSLPFPIVYKPAGYDKKAFLEKLEKVQSRADTAQSKGRSPNRWDGTANGSMDYLYRGWSWPSGLMTYFKGGVPPSQAFYKLIMGKELATLPTYGR